MNSIADVIFTRYLFAFELTSALLIIAAVGAMVLGARRTRRAQADPEAGGPGADPQRPPAAAGPAPACSASGDAIGTPALLPDGSQPRPTRCSRPRRAACASFRGEVVDAEDYS